MNKKLSKVLEKYLKFRDDIEDGESLLKIKSPSALRDHLQKIVNKQGFTPNILRKSFLSYKEKTGYKNYQERKDISAAMAHSLTQQLEYSKKN